MNDLLISRLSSAMLHIRKAGASLTEPLELNMMELLAMLALKDNKPDSAANVFAQDLTCQLHASKAAISQMLATLEKRGFVERELNTENRRKLTLTLTDEGRQSLAAVQAQYAQLMGDVIRDFGEENTLTMIALFEQFAASIDRHEAEAAQTRKGRWTDECKT